LSSPVTLPLESRYETSFSHTAPRWSDGPVRMYEQWQRKRHARKSKHINLCGHSAHERHFRYGSALRSAVRASLHAAVSSPAKQHVNTPFGRLRNLVAGLFVLAAPAFADTQPIAPGTALTAAQAAHAFDAGCLGTVPALIQGKAAIFQTAFFFGPTEGDADASYASSDGEIAVAIDGSPISTTCTMTISAEVGGDGADLYDSVVSHLVAQLGAEPEADYTDGGFTLELLAESAQS